MKVIRLITYILIILIFCTCRLNKGAYSIAYETSVIRGDGTPTYFVLVDPIDLANDGFKKDINKIIKEIIGLKGKNISINIFDNKGCLENNYQNQIKAIKFGDNKEDAEHHIADYRGKTPTGSWIIFFPGFSPASVGTPIEKYFEVKIFDLSKL